MTMPNIVINGESIEGAKVKGSSRKPLDYKGKIKENGVILHKFISRFNTRAKILEELDISTNKISDNAHTSTNDEIICDDSLLRCKDRRYSSELVSNASATHGTNSWSFAHQTNIMITRSHQSIEDGMRRRNMLNQQINITEG